MSRTVTRVWGKCLAIIIETKQQKTNKHKSVEEFKQASVVVTLAELLFVCLFGLACSRYKLELVRAETRDLLYFIL